MLMQNLPLRLQLEHLGSTEATGSSKEPTLYTGGFGGLGVDLFEYSIRFVCGGGSCDNLSKGTKFQFIRVCRSSEIQQSTNTATNLRNYPSTRKQWTINDLEDNSFRFNLCMLLP